MNTFLCVLYAYTGERLPDILRYFFGYVNPQDICIINAGLLLSSRLHNNIPYWVSTLLHGTWILSQWIIFSCTTIEYDSFWWYSRPLHGAACFAKPDIKRTRESWDQFHCSACLKEEKWAGNWGTCKKKFLYFLLKKMSQIMLVIDINSLKVETQEGVLLYKGSTRI